MRKRALTFVSVGLFAGLISAQIIKADLDWDEFLIRAACCGPIFFFAVCFGELVSNNFTFTKRPPWRTLAALVTFTSVIPIAMLMFPFALWFLQSPTWINDSNRTNNFAAEPIFGLLISSLTASVLVTLAVWALSGRWQRRLLVSLQIANVITILAIYLKAALENDWTTPGKLWEVMLPVGEGLYSFALGIARLDPEQGRVEAGCLDLTQL